MIENYKQLIKCINVLREFEEYRSRVGYGARLKPFSYMTLSGCFMYNAGKLSINSDKGETFKVNGFLHNDRYRTKITCNKLFVGKQEQIERNAPYFNIQYSDDFLKITSPELYKYDLEVKKLFDEEQHFQYSVIDDIPNIEVLKEAQDIFDLLLSEDVGYIGSLELPHIDYDNFLRWMRDETIYVSKFWEGIDV